MSNTKKPIVHLRVYKGLQLFYDANGKVMNPNQLVKITYDTIEWKNLIKNIPSLGFNSVKIEKVLDGSTLQEIEVNNDIKNVVDGLFKVKEKELTPDQKRIAELEEKINKLTANSEKKTEKPILLLDDLRKEYESLKGEVPDARWKEQKLVQLIEDLKENK